MGKHKLETACRTLDHETSVYTLAGDLFGNPEGYAFQDEVRKQIAAGKRKIVIDLESIVRIDSSGIGILVAVMWSASRAGGGLVLASIPARVEKILEIAMLLDHIEHAESVEAAVATLERMNLEQS
jgi:anti-anti-sigma factor